MKTLEWTPIALHVVERSDRLIAVLVQDPGETLALPMKRDDARAIGKALVALADELDARFGVEPPAIEIPVDGPLQ